MATIEYADDFKTEQRIVAARNSLQIWYKKRHTELIEADLKLRMQAAKERDPVRRAELTKQIELSGKELELLNNGMRYCELNRAFDKSEKVTACGSEQRLQPTADPTLKQQQDYIDSDIRGQKLKMTGYAAVYESETTIAGYFREIIRRGAFTEVLKKRPNVVHLLNHDNSLTMARTTAGSLRLYDTNIGMLFWADILNNDLLAASIVARIRNGILTQCSFAFSVADDGDTWELPSRPHELPLRIITNFSGLYDTSVVTVPAYSETSVSIVAERDGTDLEFLDYAENQTDDLELLEAAKWERQWLWGQKNRNQPVDIERMRDIRRKYRKAGRIKNRCSS